MELGQFDLNTWDSGANGTHLSILFTVTRQKNNFLKKRKWSFNTPPLTQLHSKQFLSKLSPL